MTSWSLWLARKRGFWGKQFPEPWPQSKRSSSWGKRRAWLGLATSSELLHSSNCTEHRQWHVKLKSGKRVTLWNTRDQNWFKRFNMSPLTRSLKIFFTFCVNPLSRVETDSCQDCNSRSLLSNCPPPASLVVNPPHPDCDIIFSDFDMVWISASSAT